MATATTLPAPPAWTFEPRPWPARAPSNLPEPLRTARVALVTEAAADAGSGRDAWFAHAGALYALLVMDQPPADPLPLAQDYVAALHQLVAQLHAQRSANHCLAAASAARLANQAVVRWSLSPPVSEAEHAAPAFLELQALQAHLLLQPQMSASACMTLAEGYTKLGGSQGLYWRTHAHVHMADAAQTTPALCLRYLALAEQVATRGNDASLAKVIHTRAHALAQDQARRALTLGASGVEGEGEETLDSTPLPLPVADVAPTWGESARLAFGRKLVAAADTWMATRPPPPTAALVPETPMSSGTMAHATQLLLHATPDQVVRACRDVREQKLVQLAALHGVLGERQRWLMAQAASEPGLDEPRERLALDATLARVAKALADMMQLPA